MCLPSTHLSSKNMCIGEMLLMYSSAIIIMFLRTPKVEVPQELLLTSWPGIAMRPVEKKAEPLSLDLFAL